MIYAGTFPGRPTGDDQLNVVNCPNTGKGNWGRALVKSPKKGRSPRKPAEAMLALGRYWTGAMPGDDKAWWVARAAADLQRCRDGDLTQVTGYGLFLMSNIAGMTVGPGPVKIPPASGDVLLPVFTLDSVEASTRRLKVHLALLDTDPEDWFCQFFISAIRPGNVTQGDPLRNTELIGFVEPNENIVFPDPPTIPQYLYLPWAVKVGNVVGFHVALRFGDKAGVTDWWGETYPISITELVAT